MRRVGSFVLALTLAAASLPVGLLASTPVLAADSVVDGSPSASEVPRPSALPSLTTVESPAANPTASPTSEPAATARPAPDETARPAPSPRDGAPHVAPQVQPEPQANTPTTTIIYNPPIELIVGKSNLVQAYVAETVPGGALSLKIDGVTVDTQPLAGTTFTQLHYTPSAKGTVELTVAYSGTTGYEPSTSEALTLPVVSPYPSVTVDIPYTVVRNQAAHLIATVSPDPGSGDVEFAVDDVVVGTVALSAGVASYDAYIASVGYHSISARYTGNDSWSPKDGWADHRLLVFGDPVTLDVSVGGNPIAAGPVTATVTVSPNPGGGSLDWQLGGNSGSVPVGEGGVAQIDLGTLAPSQWTLHLQFGGYDTWGSANTDYVFNVWSTSSATLATNRTTAYQGELPVVLTATIEAYSVYGTVTFLDDVGGSVLELGSVAVNEYTKQATLSSSALRIGTHSIRARFNAPSGIIASTSAPVTVTVYADTAVHATFKPSAATFYPYRDAFRDTVSLGGLLDEKATVTIRVYSSTGSLKRTFSLGTRSPGKYAATWNGTTSTGAKVAAGKYTVKASFKDTKGHTRTITGYTTVSWRQAMWLTATAITRYGDQLAYYGTPGTALYYSNDYSRGRIMDAGSMWRDCDKNGSTCEYIYGRITFQLKTGVLDYRSVLVRVVGHGFVEREHSGDGYFINPATNAWVWNTPLPYYWDPGTVYNLVPSRSMISSTSQLKVVLSCSEMSGDAFDLHYLKLSYQYAVWK